MPVTPSVHSIQNIFKQQSQGFASISGRIISSLLFSLILLIGLTGCPRSTPLPPGPENGLHADELDSLWAVDSRRYHNITIRVEPADEAINQQMRCMISGNGVSVHFGLYDDGGVDIHQDAVGFADSLSGDIYAEDGIFNRRVSSLFASSRGEYTFKFALSDSGHLDTLIVPVIIGEPEGLIVLEIDNIMILGAEELHRITVSVNPKEHGENREMYCVIRGGDVDVEFQLYDDGGFGRWHDASAFADSISGDHLADNVVYTRMINSYFTYSIGNFDFTFSLSGDNPPETITKNVFVMFWNPPPVIKSVNFPDSLASGEDELVFSTVVVDSNGSDDIVDVSLVLVENDQFIIDDNSFSMTAVNDSTWEWTCIPSISAGFATGDYPFLVWAEDAYQRQNHEHVSSEMTYVWLENLPPMITDVFGPDTVWLPEASADSFDFKIIVKDDQGFTDLDSLLLEFRRDDVVLERYLYFDDGTTPDSAAGDGCFNPGFSIGFDNEPYVTYTFVWTPTDRSPQRGESFTTSLVIMPYNGVMGRNDNAQMVKGRKCYPLIK
ncbi:MAG: hypothetical protein HQ568_03640 [Calditrichaeota bacterium]|nr:hypothetical protein [Calditrichota bacterium]